VYVCQKNCQCGYGKYVGKNTNDEDLDDVEKNVGNALNSMKG
jgi:hypothetical protein